MFVLVSAVALIAKATGRQPNYSQAFLAVWMLSLPIAVGWLGIVLVRSLLWVIRLVRHLL